MYKNDGVPRIRTQRDVDTYNAAVSSESDMLVCSREFVIGSNIRQFLCMTVAQRDRLREQARRDATLIFEASNRVLDPAQ